MILFTVATFGLFGYAIYLVTKLIKHPMPKTIDYKKELFKILYFVLGVAASCTLLFTFLSLWQNYGFSTDEWAQMVFGSFLLGLTIPSFALSFVIHYYGKEIPEKTKEILFYEMIGSGVMSLISILLITNSVADHLVGPLVNRLSFQRGFLTPDVSPIEGEISITFYAICILSGALLVYFICDHRFYKEYGEHGILESTLFVAFPAGIIGARIGYVIGNWEKDEFYLDWTRIFKIWEGGLTVISGALVGIVVGVIWFVLRKKKYSIWLAVDVIVPCILVAQAIGRWGNFFNCEVHGTPVNASDWWLLPKIVSHNAQYSVGSTSVLSEGQIYAPLFYVEFLSNMIGYFLIRFGLGKGLRKYIEMGDLAGSYIVWYGLTRVIMEPMRDRTFNMGNDDYYSWVWAIMFVVIGMALILINHIWRFFYRKEKKLPIVSNRNRLASIITTSIIFGSAIAMIIVGSIMMSSSSQNSTLVFDTFNNGIIILSVGSGILLVGCISLLYLLEPIVRKDIYAPKEV